jgi:hypothetical protein
MASAQWRRIFIYNIDLGTVIADMWCDHSINVESTKRSWHCMEIVHRMWLRELSDEIYRPQVERRLTWLPRDFYWTQMTGGLSKDDPGLRLPVRARLLVAAAVVWLTRSQRKSRAGWVGELCPVRTALLSCAVLRSALPCAVVHCAKRCVWLASRLRPF